MMSRFSLLDRSVSCMQEFLESMPAQGPGSYIFMGMQP